MRNTPRPFSFELGVNPYSYGSCFVKFGHTQVYVTVSLSEEVPPFLKGKNQGWLTAEYSMLPGSSNQRVPRERKGASGRTQEIQRLIGRSLRACLDFTKLGPRSLTVDCDVIVADGGTRTASINGGMVCLLQAVDRLMKEKVLLENPIHQWVAALSIGLDQERNILADLNYQEDSQCITDLNLVLTEQGGMVEVQATAEKGTYTAEELQQMLACGKMAMKDIFAQMHLIQKKF
jgi:ribonuclease PH